MSGALEEYKELRSELRLMLDRREKVRNFAYTIALGVLGLSFSEHVPNDDYRAYLLVVGAYCVFALWFDEIRRMRAIFRIATYIEVFTEPKFHDMHWENWGGKHNIQHSKADRILANGDLAVLGVVLAGLGIEMLIYRHAVIGVLIGIGLLTVMLFTGFQGFLLFKRGRPSEKLRWERISSDHAAELSSR